LVERLHGFNAGAQAGALARDGLGFGGFVPKGRVFDPGIQLIELSKCGIPVKDAS